MKIQEIAALISVRDFAFRAIDNIYVKMTAEEVKVVGNKIKLLDRQIIDSIIKYDASLEEGVKKKNEIAK